MGYKTMQENLMYTAQDVAEMLSVSASKAYKLIQSMNKELEQQGKLVIRGKINRRFFDKKMEV